MYRALSTGCFAFLKRAFLKTLLSIFQQGGTLAAQSIGGMVLTTIQLAHLSHGLALSSDSVAYTLKSIGLTSPAQAFVYLLDGHGLNKCQFCATKAFRFSCSPRSRTRFPGTPFAYLQ
jgi:hypothetical protein